MINLVLNSLNSFGKEKKMWLLLFLFSLIPALFFGGAFFSKAMNVSGTSLEVNRLVEGFDFMAFSDFMKSGKDVIKPLYLWSLAGGFVFLLVNIYLSGGVVERAVNQSESFSFASFFSKSTKRFPKFLLIYLFVLLLAFCFFLACGILYFVFSLLAENGNDKSLFLWLSIPTIILIISMSFVVCVSDYSKVLLARHPFLPTSEAFSKAFGYVWKRPKALGSMWFLVVLGVMSLALYLLIDKTIGMTTMVGIIIMVVVQQVYSFFRIFLRFSHLKVANDLYNIDPLAIKEPIIEIIEENEEEESFFDANQEPPQAESGLDNIPEDKQ